MLRSSVITDLRYGFLIDEDWNSNDRFDNVQEDKNHLPLPQHVQSYAIASTLGTDQTKVINSIVGDGLVPFDSALGKHSKSECCLNFTKSSQ